MNRKPSSPSPLPQPAVPCLKGITEREAAVLSVYLLYQMLVFSGLTSYAIFDTVKMINQKEDQFPSCLARNLLSGLDLLQAGRAVRHCRDLNIGYTFEEPRY